MYSQRSPHSTTGCLRSTSSLLRRRSRRRHASCFPPCASRAYGPVRASSTFRARWKNADYDKIVDQVYVTPMEDKTKLQGLFRQAMEIWLPNLPDIQLVHLYHTIARNETYWTGWPTQDDPYINPAHFHLTFQMVMHRVSKAAAAS